MGIVELAIGDAAITFLWVFGASCLGAGTSVIASYLGVQGAMTLLITLSLLFLLVFLFSFLGEAMGGATWNPTALAAAFALGVGKDNLISLSIRFPAQSKWYMSIWARSITTTIGALPTAERLVPFKAAGAVGGALAIMELMPASHKHMLGGPSLKVDLHKGAIAEGVLTFVISIMVFLIIMKGPKSSFWKSWLISLTTIILVLAGSGYTGPSMNPANAFGWAYVNNRHNTWEQLYVYWITPFIGSILAAWTLRLISPPNASKKEKKA